MSSIRIDWNEVKAEFPRAFKTLHLRKGWVSYNFIQSLYDAHGPSILMVQAEPDSWHRFDVRDLYDFFDDYGINIGIDIRIEDGEKVFDCGMYESTHRCDAEAAAFMWAFKCLEDMQGGV